MANFVSVIAEMMLLYNFTIPLVMVGEPGKRHNVRAQLQEDFSDWLNPFSMGTMSASAYIENLD